MVGDRVPWSSLKWTVTLHDARGPVSLSMGQTLMVFAAVELDRVWSLDDVRRAQARAKSSGEFWAVLVQGARGLRPDEAGGDMTIAECFERLKVVSAQWSFGRGREQSRRELAEALAEAS